MTQDLLARFRRTPPTAGAAPVGVAAEAKPAAYAPYGIAETARPRLWLRGERDGIDHAPEYRAIYDIVTDGKTGITLMLEKLCVDIDGRNLGTLFYNLTRERVEWVQVFEAGRWVAPPEGEPVITRIEVQVMQRAAKPEAAP